MTEPEEELMAKSLEKFGTELFNLLVSYGPTATVNALIVTLGFIAAKTPEGEELRAFVQDQLRGVFAESCAKQQELFSRSHLRLVKK